MLSLVYSIGEKRVFYSRMIRTECIAYACVGNGPPSVIQS